MPTVKPEQNTINLRLTAQAGGTDVLNRLESWAKLRGISLTAAARVLLVKGLEADEASHG